MFIYLDFFKYLIILYKFNKDEYKEPFIYKVNYDVSIPGTDIEQVDLIKQINFADNITIGAHKVLEIFNNSIIIKFKLLYTKTVDNQVDVDFRIRVNVELIPQIILTLIRPFFTMIVEQIFNKEREEEYNIYTKLS